MIEQRHIGSLLARTAHRVGECWGRGVEFLKHAERTTIFCRTFALLGFLVSALPAQAEPKTRSFYADLSSAEESTVTQSSGSGTLDITVDIANLKMHYRIVYAGLVSEVTSINLHGPCGVGDVAPAILNLASNGARPPIEAEVSLTDGQLKYMLNGELYINVQTRKYAEGEIRGQLQRAPDQLPGVVRSR